MQMDLSHSLLEIISKPTFVFVSPATPPARQDTFSWDSSPLNPKNRIDSLNTTRSNWRIDGVNTCGTQYYAVPNHPKHNLLPLRIDVFVPDQEEHPIELRSVLQSSRSASVRHPYDVADLGISRHLCRALDHHCDKNPQFWDEYQRLPFGSKLVFQDIVADPKKMALVILPAYNLEKQSLSVASLQKIWDGQIPADKWPETIDIGHLRLERELHDSVSLVHIVKNSHSMNQSFIFKSNADDLKYLYHELKFLLTCPPHPNVMTSPLYIVTKKSSFGGKHGIYGFILPYYSLGSIRDKLPTRNLTGTLNMKLKLKWSRQITLALIHIREKARSFYSDLRPDNILLSSSEAEECEDAVLIDFEQRGNWYEWCPPEVLYISYLEQIRPHIALESDRKRWGPLVTKYLPNNTFSNRHNNHVYNNTSHGRNFAWFSLSSEAQEKAEVYSLGLLFYCIFEGMSNIRISAANLYPYDPHLSFPEFKQTPESMRECIRKCTIGAPEWEVSQTHRSAECMTKRPMKVVRKGSKLYPANLINVDKDPRDIAQEVWKSARAWWENELDKAERFLDPIQQLDDCGVGKRPTLRDVLAMLESIAAIECV